MKYLFSDESYQAEIEQLKKRIEELETNLKSAAPADSNTQLQDYAIKIEELTKLFESEKSKKERANIKLRSYKDKILKCANCINQLKNSRFILTKTVKEYSENIPKWQNEIIKASKVLEGQMKELSNENNDLKTKLQQKQKELLDLCSTQSDSNDLKCQINELKENAKQLNSKIFDLQEELSETNKTNVALIDEIANLRNKETDSQLLKEKNDQNATLKEQINQLQAQLDIVTVNSIKFEETIANLTQEKSKLKNMLQTKKDNDEAQERTNLLIKALESEKATLVKEKQNAKDNILELENRNKSLNDLISKMREELHSMNNHITFIEKENEVMKDNYKLEKDEIVKELKKEVMLSKEQYDKLKKEYDNVQDLNSLLQEEVETLKLSLEQPKDDTYNLSDLNVSLQADIAKLETKLAAYKQENASLLLEVKDSRSKIKKFDDMVVEYEDMKSKLACYKNENGELLNEMKEINEVLKERGETISKLQKAISEMERLIEILEKDRDAIKDERDSLLNEIDNLRGDLKNAEQNNCKNSAAVETITIEKDTALNLLEEKDAIILGLKEELEKLRQTSSKFKIFYLGNGDLTILFNFDQNMKINYVHT